MELALYRTLWGINKPLSDLVESLKDNGFQGVEGRIPETTLDRERLSKTLLENDLNYIGILFTGSGVVPDQSESIKDHIERFERRLDDAQELPCERINVLAGNDRWPMADQCRFFEKLLTIADQKGVACCFETHRATSLYSPWLTLELIEQLPELRFTADISHWVLVCERLLNQPHDDLTPFLDRVDHIQARIGTDQTPQVIHPAAPEVTPWKAYFQSVWASIWARHAANGRAITTMTTEFGVDGYLTHQPFTQMPMADLHEVNAWMAKESRNHFNTFKAGLAAKNTTQA
jgi:sugar phosphate isomerase/epimerase